MPVKSRKHRPEGFRWDELEITDFLSLKTGRTYGETIIDEESLLAAWEANEDELMALSPPGTRPKCWWRFCAPEGRRVAGRPRVLAVFDPDVMHGPHADWRAGRSRFTAAELEPERDYLERLGLLTDDEEG